MSLAATAALGAGARRKRQKKAKAAARRCSTEDATRAVAALYDAEADERGGVTRESTRRVMATLAKGSEVSKGDLDMVRRRACNFSSGFAAAAVAVPAGPESGDDPPAAAADAVDESEARLETGPLIEATVRWCSYLEHRRPIDAMYAKFSREKLGNLTPRELQHALESAERKAGRRDAFGIIFEVVPSKTDVATVISTCDVDQDGYINKIEIISALHAWRVLATKHAKAQSEVCAIM